MSTIQQVESDSSTVREKRDLETPSFYRPELDALRFFAFLAVYICHSIPNNWANAVSHSNGGVGLRFLVLMKDAGNFGVCLFFFLSAFLITELLRREEMQFGTIDVAWFYVRRILRIWPLYFGITLVYAVGGTVFPALHMEPGRVAAYFLLMGNWYLLLHPWLQTPLRALWSISVEEQFYLVWPLAAKLSGMRGLAVLAIVLIPVSMVFIITSAVGSPYTDLRIWLNSFTQFQFFGWGALLALALYGTSWKAHGVLRAAMLMAGILLWLIAAAMRIRRPGAHVSPSQFAFGYLLVAVGCVLLFLSALGVSPQWIPQKLAYLGKISFGLYVFHETGFLFADELQKRAAQILPSCGSWIEQHAVLVLSLNKLTALLITILLAWVSYRFWESPFLRLKERFTFVRSRAV